MDGSKGEPEPQPELASRAGNAAPAPGAFSHRDARDGSLQPLRDPVDTPSPDPASGQDRVPVTVARMDLSLAT
jgi:hypothetical protein